MSITEFVIGFLVASTIYDLLKFGINIGLHFYYLKRYNPNQEYTSEYTSDYVMDEDGNLIPIPKPSKPNVH